MSIYSRREFVSIPSSRALSLFVDLLLELERSTEESRSIFIKLIEVTCSPSNMEENFPKISKMNGKYHPFFGQTHTNKVQHFPMQPILRASSFNSLGILFDIKGGEIILRELHPCCNLEVTSGVSRTSGLLCCLRSDLSCG